MLNDDFDCIENVNILHILLYILYCISYIVIYIVIYGEFNNGKSSINEFTNSILQSKYYLNITLLATSGILFLNKFSLIKFRIERIAAKTEVILSWVKV